MPAFAACLAVLYVSSDICCGFSSKTRVLLTQSFWKSACKRASEKLLYNHDNKSESLCTSAFRDCELEVYGTLSWLSWLKGTNLLSVIEKGWYPDEDRAFSMLAGRISITRNLKGVGPGGWAGEKKDAVECRGRWGVWRGKFLLKE